MSAGSCFCVWRCGMLYGKGVIKLERIDWTKLLVPRIVNSQAQSVGVENIKTTDLVTVHSVAEFSDANNLFRKKSATDYARTTNGYAKYYWLRDTGAVGGGNIETPETEIHFSLLGLAPSISLRLPKNYTLAQIVKWLGLTQQTTADGTKYYQVTLGEYPQSFVSSDIGYELRKQFAGQETNDEFSCTGRLFTTVTLETNESNLYQRNYPEFIFRGERYVRVPEKTWSGEQWFKVEPITWWVKNFDDIAQGKATQIDLDSTQVIMGGIPFQERTTNSYASVWKNSLIRAFLNSADSRTLDGEPNYQVHDCHWNFSQSGFLEQALNLTREPTRNYTISKEQHNIGTKALAGCRGLEKVYIPANEYQDNNDYCGENQLMDCNHLQIYLDVNHDILDVNRLRRSCFPTNLQYFYVPKRADGKWIVLTATTDPTLDGDYRCFDDIKNNPLLYKFFNRNFRENYNQIMQWKEQNKIKFMPPEFTLETFPAGEMANYFINNNHKRWAELVKTVRFDLLDDQEKTNSLTDLMKIYYALGGFSTHQGKRDQAFNYVVQHVARYQPNINQIGIARIADDIHRRFSRLVLKGPYNPTFAQFFMKYYHANPDFMRFEYDNQCEQDYLCAAHNSFAELLQNYPNRVVHGNTVRNLLTPQFVAEHCLVIKYENVASGNATLAETVGRYGYTQKQFDRMQTIYQQAKNIKDCAVIHAEPTTDGKVSFRVLDKDDPLGFVIGDITNCCQHLGGIGESCVIDGYTNPNAGFLVFETAAYDADGTPTGETRILGQAYVWYDPQTKTVCYDNIEIPDKVLSELQKGTTSLSLSSLTQAVINSADAIMTTMNRNGTKVASVTVGKGCNDLCTVLNDRFTLTSQPAVHRTYNGYTDAQKQYLIRTYDQTTSKLTTVQAGGGQGCLKEQQATIPDADREI